MCDNCVTQGKALTRPGPVSLLDEEAGPQRLFRPPELPNSHPEVAEFKLFFFFFKEADLLCLRVDAVWKGKASSS